MPVFLFRLRHRFMHRFVFLFVPENILLVGQYFPDLPVHLLLHFFNLGRICPSTCRAVSTRRTATIGRTVPMRRSHSRPHSRPPLRRRTGPAHMFTREISAIPSEARTESCSRTGRYRTEHPFLNPDFLEQEPVQSVILLIRKVQDRFQTVKFIPDRCLW